MGNGNGSAEALGAEVVDPLVHEIGVLRIAVERTASRVEVAIRLSERQDTEWAAHRTTITAFAAELGRISKALEDNRKASEKRAEDSELRSRRISNDFQALSKVVEALANQVRDALTQAGSAATLATAAEARASSAELTAERTGTKTRALERKVAKKDAWHVTARVWAKELGPYVLGSGGLVAALLQNGC